MKKENLISKFLLSAEDVKWLFANTKKRIPQFLLLALLNFINACTGAIFALVTKDVVNATVNRQPDKLFSSTLILLIIIIVQIATSSFAYHLHEKLHYTLDRDLKQTVFHTILSRDYSGISAYHSGELLQRMNWEVSTVVTSLITICSSVVSLTTSLVAAAIVLFRLAPGFTLFIIPVCLVLAVATLFFERNLKLLSKNVSRASGKLSGFYQETMERLLIVQGLDIIREMEKKSDDLINKRISFQRQRKNIQVEMDVATNVLGYMGSFVALIWCAIKVVHGVFDYGTLTAITTLVSQLQSPLLTMPAIIPKFISLAASTERILEVVNIPEQAEVADFDVYETYGKIKKIRGENLTFYYPNLPEKKIILDNLDFSLDLKGMSVLTGTSGCGKSTLLKLFMGIYRPISGELYFETGDGERIPINRSTRSLFSYAPQGNLIFSGTIRENIMIVNPSATQEELENAIYVSAMDAYLSELPDGLDTELGENGAGLSEGQIQRINIARSVLRKAPILLFDEVTSSLDMETEKTVLERISHLDDIACIAVTHRPAALDIADRRLHVSGGKAEEIAL